MKKMYLCLIFIVMFLNYDFSPALYGFTQDQTAHDQIKTDPRIELIAIVMFLSQEKMSDLNHFETQYTRDIQNHFSQFSNHEAITQCEKLWYSGFNADAPMTYALYHTDPPQFDKLLEYSDKMIDRAKHKEILEQWTSALRDFSHQSDFPSFYRSHEEYYRTLITHAIETIKDRFSYHETMTEFYGKQKDAYTMILAPLINEGGYGPRIILNNREETYCIIGPQSDFSLQKERMGDIIWFQYVPFHEFSHSYVNPITAKNESTVMEYEKLFSAISDTMDNQAYGSWITCVNEHLVRANVIRMMVKTFDDPLGLVAQSILVQERNRVFIFIDDLHNLMIEYENKRSVYPTYESFYPTILGYFQDQWNRLEVK